MLNNYELFGLVIRVLWTIVVYTTIIWAIVYGIQLIIGGLQILNEKGKENEK